jgi:hypothetical protein
MSAASCAKWSSISEILSSLAVVVTLVFLGVQTHQNTEAINAQLVANQAQSRAAIWELVSQSIEQSVVSPAITLNLRSTRTLTAEEQEELDNWMLGFWSAREFIWLQYQDGLVDRLTYETIVDEGHMLAIPRMGEWWDRNALKYYNAGFVETVNTDVRHPAAGR